MNVTSQNSSGNTNAVLSMHPLKFALWLFIVSIVMIFGSLTSAYLVRMAEGNWMLFDLPVSLTVNTVILILSSVTMHLAYMNAKKNNIFYIKVFMFLTIVLGFLFLAGQWKSWVDLVGMNVFFVGNPSGSFLYVLSGLHAFHLISGLIYLIIVLISSFKNRVNSERLTGIEMCATYWHFLDGLWLYLFLFLYLNH
jgi:cytochrome c oxidase subunit 3